MTIRTEIITIDNEKRIALQCSYNTALIAEIRKIPGRRWSASRKFWHIPYFPNYLEELNARFRGKLEFEKENGSKKNAYQRKEKIIDQEFLKFLRMKNYCEPTIKTYSFQLRKFLRFYNDPSIEKISSEKIRKYIIHMVEVEKLSVSYQNNAINALKIFFNDFLQMKVDDFYLPRPKKPRRIPDVLNEQEVASILKEVKDIRDKCMICLVYSAGLTPSEIIYLKPEQIDQIRMKIFISSPKGDKDRFVVLAEKVLKLLRSYFKEYKPKEWLFESRPGQQYSKRNLQKSFHCAVQKSGISKKANLLILRNSFAVHLMEKGIDIRYIQKMLGHKNSITTLKYLKATKKDINAIRSPLDNLEI